MVNEAQDKFKQLLLLMGGVKVVRTLKEKLGRQEAELEAEIEECKESLKRYKEGVHD